MKRKFKYAPSARKPKDWQKAVTHELAVLDKICRDNDIEYFISSGGLLGAVRHKGFIPWDNDVDIQITEENYLKLRQVYLDGKMPDGYMLADQSTEPSYPLLFARFLNKNTSCPLSTSSFNGGVHGVFIDVFIMFGVPDDPSECQEALTDFLVWEQQLCYLKRRCISRKPEFHEKWAALKAFEAQHGRAAALEKAEADFRRHIPVNPSRYLLGSGGARNCYPLTEARWYREAVRIPFEDIEVCAPVDAREVLDRHYGSSWRRVPASGTEFKPYCAASLTIPHDVVSADYMQLIDEERCTRDFDSYLEAMMAESAAKCASMEAVLGVLGELIGAQLDKEAGALAQRYSAAETYASSSYCIEDARRDYAVVGSLICEQLRREFKTWAHPIPASPAVIASSLWVRATAFDDLWVPQKALGIQKDNPAFAAFLETADGRALLEFIETSDALYLHIDAADKAAIERDAATLARLCPNSIHAQVARICLLSTKPAELLGALDELPARALENDYLRFFKALALLRCGRVDEAELVFSQLYHLGTNAYMRLWIDELVGEQVLNLLPAEATPPFEKTPGVRFAHHSLKIRSYGLKALAAVSRHGGFFKLRALAKESVRAAAAARKTSEQVERYRSIRRITDRRINTWERMYPRKEALRQAVASGNKDEALALARPYINSLVNAYENDGNGIFIDLEIEQLVRPLMEEQLGSAKVESMIKAIPEKHRIDIDVMLREKGVDHPYLR